MGQPPTNKSKILLQKLHFFMIVQLPQNWARSPPVIVFFPDGSGTPIPVSKLFKDLGVQTDNVFSPSVQCTEAANKAR